MFYSVAALLLSKDLSSSKHSGLMGLFNREFVKSGLINKELGRFYNEMFDFRQKSDYKDLVKFEIKEVGAWLSKAGEFITAVKGLIK